MKYNHQRQLKSFSEEIRKIREAGFNLIAVTQMYFEDTFVFATSEEASAAHAKLEKEDRQVVGWWYGERDFAEEVQKYEDEDGSWFGEHDDWLIQLGEMYERIEALKREIGE